MLTDIRSRALLVLSLGLIPVGGTVHGQATTPAPQGSTDGTIEVSYHLKALKRTKQGAYEMSGTLRGERQGKANVEFAFEEGSSGKPNNTLVHTYWVVRAEPESESFKARLRGTADVVSGQTHLVGTITEGAGKGLRVETKSRLLNFGPNGALSDIDGNMVIGGEGAPAEPDTTAKKEP
jgi:hypothetical protein